MFFVRVEDAEPVVGEVVLEDGTLGEEITLPPGDYPVVGTIYAEGDDEEGNFAGFFYHTVTVGEDLVAVPVCVIEFEENPE